jgi:hypothetical protein
MWRHPWVIVAVAAVCAGVLGVSIALVAGSGSHRASSPRALTPPRSGQHAGGGSPATGQAVSSWASGNQGLAPAVPASAVANQALDNVFALQQGPGWIGGDSAYSTVLRDGREAFVFADSYIGTAQSDGVPSFTGLAHSTELVGTMNALTSDYGGTFSVPLPLIPDIYDPSAIWEPLATYTQGNDQLIFVNEYKGPPGILSLHYTGRSGIAVMSVPSNGLPKLESVTLLPDDPIITWGSAVVEDGRYLYAYGADISGAKHAVTGMEIARVPVNDSLDLKSWTFWNGSKWVAGASNAVVLQTTNDLTGVVANPDGKGFIGVSVPWGVFNDKTVDLSYSESPQGPWSAPQPVYTIPEITQYRGEMAYFPTFHTELSSSPDQLVVSYNIDTDVGYPVLEQDIHSYQPRFITITG